MGTFELSYPRDKQQREVDFVMIRDRKPWFLVEVKSGRDHLSPALKDQIKAPHAFQVVLDRNFVAADGFSQPWSQPGRCSANYFKWINTPHGHGPGDSSCI